MTGVIRRVPRSLRSVQGRVAASRRISHRHPQHITIVDPHQTNPTESIASKTTPAPLLRLQDQSPRYGILVHIVQLFDSLVFRPKVEIVKARLPDGHRFCHWVPRSLLFCKGRVPAGRRRLRLGTTLCANRCFTLCIAVDGVPTCGSLISK